MKDRATITKIERRVRLSCILALAALVLITWSLLDPRPLPVIGAMSVAQGLGTLSFLFFLYAIFEDLRKQLNEVRKAATSSKGPSDS